MGAADLGTVLTGVVRCGSDRLWQGLPAALCLLRSCRLAVLSPWLKSSVCIFAVGKAPINLSQVMCASSGSEEASAPMHLTNDRL